MFGVALRLALGGLRTWLIYNANQADFDRAARTMLRTLRRAHLAAPCTAPLHRRAATARFARSQTMVGTSPVPSWETSAAPAPRPPRRIVERAPGPPRPGAGV